MASLRKIGEKWLAEVRIKGKSSSKTHLTKNEAKDWAHNEEQRLRNPSSIVPGKTLGEALEKYAREESPKKKGARWEMIRLEKLRRDPLASVLLSDLSADDFDDWIKRQYQAGLKGSSIRREIGIFSPVLTLARKRWKWLEGYPLENVNSPKKAPPRKKLITEDEIKNILTALGYEEGTPVTTRRQKIAFAFLFAIETAMRQGEIWKMDWKDVNWKDCYVFLSDTKNGTDREVPLSSRAVQLLQAMSAKTSGPVIDYLPQQTAEVLFRRATETAGYKGLITFHDTRHRATTLLAEKLDMLTLARMTGHLDPRMLMTYYNPTSKSIAARLG